MKKTFLIIAMALLGMTQALAQEYEYVPFVREGVKWVYCIYNEESFYSPDPRFPIGSTYLNLEFKGDTIINGKSYKAMHKYYGQSINWENDTIPIYMREENEVVYGIVPDGKCYEDCPIGLWTYQDCYDRKLSGEEFVLYDFNDPIHFLDSIFAIADSEHSFGPFQHLYTDTISIGDHFAKDYALRYEGDFSVVEGIGYDGESSYALYLWWNTYLAAPVRNAIQVADFYLSHVVKDGQIIYKGMRYRHGAFTGIDEVVADKTLRPIDPHYYDLIGRSVGTEVPTAPGIYIHQGKKIVVR